MRRSSLTRTASESARASQRVGPRRPSSQTRTAAPDPPPPPPTHPPTPAHTAGAGPGSSPGPLHNREAKSDTCTGVESRRRRRRTGPAWERRRRGSLPCCLPCSFSLAWRRGCRSRGYGGCLPCSWSLCWLATAERLGLISARASMTPAPRLARRRGLRGRQRCRGGHLGRRRGERREGGSGGVAGLGVMEGGVAWGDGGAGGEQLQAADGHHHDRGPRPRHAHAQVRRGGGMPWGGGMAKSANVHRRRLRKKYANAGHIRVESGLESGLAGHLSIRDRHRHPIPDRHGYLVVYRRTRSRYPIPHPCPCPHIHPPRRAPWRRDEAPPPAVGQ